MSYIELYLKSGKKLVKTHGKNGKKPMISGWNKPDYTSPSLKELENIDTTRREVTLENGKTEIHYQSIAWALGEKDFILDVDVNANGFVGIKKLIEDCKKKKPDFKITPTVKSQSGGVHYYFKLTPKQNYEKLKKNLGRYPGVELKRKGHCCNIVNETEKTGDIDGYYRWYDRFNSNTPAISELDKGIPQPELPFVLYQVLCETYDKENYQKYTKYNKGLPKKITDNSVKKRLEKYLNPSMSYASWLNVGMAIHNFNPTSYGLDLWIEWSKESEKFKEGVCEEKWKTFDLDPSGITIYTLFYTPKDEETKKDWFRSNVDPETNILENQNDDSERNHVLSFDILYEEEYIKKFKEWVHVKKDDTLVHLKTKENLKVNNWGRGIFFKNNSNPGALLAGAKTLGYVDTVDATAYRPDIKKDVFFDEEDKKTYVNMFNYLVLAKADAEYTNEGKRFLRAISNHIKIICNAHIDGGKDAKILLQWLAHQVQNPGVPLRWCPLICGIQGIGKNFIYDIVVAMLGVTNAGTVPEKILKKDFTSWARNKAVNLFDEFSIRGRDAKEKENTCKMVISQRNIMTVSKGKDEEPYVNLTNYIALTNEEDALDLMDEERRFWVIKCECNSKKKLAMLHDNYLDDQSVMSYEDLFDYLYSNLKKNKGQVKKWLSELKITEEFKNLKTAPMTNYKKILIEETKHKIKYYDELSEILELDNSKYYSNEVVSVRHLFNALNRELKTILDLSPKAKNKLLKALKFIKVQTKVRLGDNVLTVWTKENMTTEQVKKYFENREKMLDENKQEKAIEKDVEEKELMEQSQ